MVAEVRGELLVDLIDLIRREAAPFEDGDGELHGVFGAEFAKVTIFGGVVGGVKRLVGCDWRGLAQRRMARGNVVRFGRVRDWVLLVEVGRRGRGSEGNIRSVGADWVGEAERDGRGTDG